MSYNKLGFTSGQTLKAEHLNHMEDGIEVIANNVQIKKAVFTDRPSLWAWLQANYTKISNVKLWTSVSQCVDDMIFIGHSDIGMNQPQRFSFYTMTVAPERTNEIIDKFVLTFSEVEVYSDMCEIAIYQHIDVLNDEVTKEGQHQIIQDELWSVMGIEVTIYYFDE